MAAPVSNGAIVADETAVTNVAVNFNFSNTGTGGVLEVFQSTNIAHINSGFPDHLDAGWTAAVDANGNPPSEGAQTQTWSHVGFAQDRGTTMYYYSRRRTSSYGLSGYIIELGSPYPVGELVPTFPYIADIVANALFTEATVISVVSDSVTTLYYYQSTSAAQPVWQATTSTQTSPAGHWSTSPTFSTVPGVQYYYYVLAWTHNNPGADGAAISAIVSRNASSKQGLEVYNASGTKIITVSDRLVRFVSTGTVSINKGSFQDVYVAGMANDDTWGVSLGMPPNLVWSTEAQFVKSANNLRITYLNAPQYGGISNPPAVTVTYYVFRT
jgi:hypothetical protein